MKKIFGKVRGEFLNQSKKSFFCNFALNYLKDKKLVLDIGCGFGNYLKLQMKSTVGMDWNYENLSQLKKKFPSTYLIQRDALRLPFPDKTFDGIHCSHLIEHFPPQSAYILLKEMNRVLASGGITVISSPLNWEGFYDDLTHVRPYSPTGILHYYANITHSRTLQKIDGEYEVIGLKYRYCALKMEPIIIPGKTLSCISILFTKFLNYLGFRRWIKNDYTLISRKIR